MQGGDTGAAIVVGKPNESLLVEAVRQQNGLAMPPDGKLNEVQFAVLVEWIKAGAIWPGAATAVATAAAGATIPIVPTPPNDGELSKSLQLWLRADSLALDDGEPVYVWPDQSGHGRDVSATKGVRAGGVGLPARFVRESSLLKRPGVRFDTSTGLASSPDNPVAIRGDAALTIMLVMNLQPHEAQPPFDTVLGIGNPASVGDPGRPLAAMVQINRGEDHALHFAGGWNHDASLGQGSFKPLYGKPILLTITKQPGPMRSTTRMFVNEEPLKTSGEPLEGTDGVPDIQHRTDVGAYLGRAFDWAGSIQGDLGEVLVYNRALTDRGAVGRRELPGREVRPDARAAAKPGARAVFTAEEKAFWAYQPVQDALPPAVRRDDWVKSPIDRFVLQQLEAKGLRPASPADKRTLLAAGHVRSDRPAADARRDRRVPDGDDSPHAFEKVVNRLLDSPHYGERWGRHWLDVVRYAETTANDANAVMRYAWRYRNYVIDAFNRDLPYDQFLIEQLAGDLLPPTDSVETEHAANHRHRLPDGRPEGARRNRQGAIAARHRRRSNRRDRPGVPRADACVCAVSRPQVRRHPHDRLLRARRHLPQHRTVPERSPQRDDVVGISRAAGPGEQPIMVMAPKESAPAQPLASPPARQPLHAGGDRAAADAGRSSSKSRFDAAQQRPAASSTRTSSPAADWSWPAGSPARPIR